MTSRYDRSAKMSDAIPLFGTGEHLAPNASTAALIGQPERAGSALREPPDCKTADPRGVLDARSQPA
ncbi:hypothetical protein SAMN04489729_1773 [Amycolatopsis lurida]|uniref:hypothetical protein n=1 Tax=Amycolatopsis lurida TaxID=31959 RepID=UPI000895DE41|nr:hypothetical protein [Amycolatopsis lurida]SEC52046.1 hypothetical protein SAMN04489729_1773 [Amycolatopsis lurida]